MTADESRTADGRTHAGVHTVAPLRIAVACDRRFGLIWLLTIILLAALLPLLTVAVVTYDDSRTTRWLEGLYQRKTLAAELRADDPQGCILILGGSNALFGLDAELIERMLDRPVVNMATHAGMGLEYHTLRARRLLAPGDIVLLSPEYEMLTASDAMIDVCWEYIITHDARYFRDIGLRRSAKLLYSVPIEEYTGSLERWSRRLRGRHADWKGYNFLELSPNGDLRRYYGKRNFEVKHRFLAENFETVAMRRFRSFVQWAHDHDVTVMLTWPSICRDPVTMSEQARSRQRNLAKRMRDMGVVLLDEPEQRIYPREFFADTPYHLTPAVRRLRSESVARGLRSTLGETPDSDDEGGLFVMAGPNHVLTPGNVFADDQDVRSVLLVREPVDHPDAVTAEDVRAALDAGRPVFFDEPAVEQVFRNAGLSAEAVAAADVSLSDLIDRHQNHLFFLTFVGADSWDGEGASNLPEPFASFVAGEGYRVALIGTGRARSHDRIERSPDGARIERRMYYRLGTGDRSPLDVVLRSGPGDEVSALVLNGIELSGSRAGFHIAVLDPELGIIVDRAFFPNGKPIRAWRLMRAVGQ
ncbi:MAG: hypothetical protein KAS72_02405 [Phycisphaerales bacterium]|nr:hypothetical protein [Phycisphaerales bacterium]